MLTFDMALKTFDLRNILGKSELELINPEISVILCNKSFFLTQVKFCGQKELVEVAEWYAAHSRNSE